MAELTRTLPAVIQFMLPRTPPALPLPGRRDSGGKFLIETHQLQKDLFVLLRWAHDNAIELRELTAGPTRLDDVFRAINNH